MSYITYGPSPTSHYRIVGTPADRLLTSPLDATPAPARRATARAVLGAASWVAIVLVAASAALALRLVIYALGHTLGLL
jgi:hypothetical protein